MAQNEHEERIYTETNDKVTLGFWIYLMTDLIMFSVLFATYAVLHTNTFGGPSGKELYDLPFALIETLVLLTSSFTCGLGMVFARRRDKIKTLILFTLTFLFGLLFLGMELSEFSKLFMEGNGYTRSAFLSSFFALVGTHGLHITTGVIWIVILLVYMSVKGVTDSALRKLTLFSLFWHFLDIVWIFIFTMVYLMGVM
jgi:cytochrome o ubiquinol oxidase subunit 3